MNEVLTIIADNTDGWHLRLHDAILCHQLDVLLIQGIMQGVLLEHLGFETKVKTGEWSKRVNEVINRHALMDNKNYLHQAYHTHRLSKLVHKKRKVYVDNPTAGEIKDRKSLFYATIRDNAEREAVDELVYLNPTLVYPADWDDIRLFQLRQMAQTTIDPILNLMPQNSAYQILVANKAAEYWETFFKTVKAK